MLTSLAPSPMAKVVLSGNLCFIIFTTSAFYFGETLQAKTTSTLSDAAKKVFLSSSSASIEASDEPATMIPWVFLSGPSPLSAFFFASASHSDRIFRNCSPSLSASPSLISCYTMAGSNSPVDKPIIFAVPTLSPVSTQTLIPARFMNSMVSLTSS